MQTVFRSRAFSGLARTALYALHKEFGGKIIPFAGYELPVQYTDGVVKSHMHTREAGCASIFDVSHMGQIRWYGKDRAKFLDWVVVGDISGLADYSGALSLILNEKGGIIDDTILMNFKDHINMVVNGANKFIDMEHFDALLAEFKGKGFDVDYEYLDQQQLVALQGDAAMKILGRFVDLDLSKMEFMTGVDTKFDDIDVRVVRCGYTGEDGFEISSSWEDAPRLFQMLADQPEVLPAGLAARDSLRLEAGLCLHGNDISPETLPNEAALMWTIPKSGREPGAFLGADKVCEMIESKWQKQRIGLMIEGSPARQHAEIYDESGEKLIGEVTSGTMSPCLKQPIAMGYVNRGFTKGGKKLSVKVRGKMFPATVTKMPFVPSNYYKP